MISAVRSATREHHLTIVRKLLEQSLAQINPFGTTPTLKLERSMHHILLARVCHLQHDGFAAQQQWNGVSKLMQDLSQILNNPELDSVHIDLVTYIYLNRCLTYRSPQHEVLVGPEKTQYSLHFDSGKIFAPSFQNDINGLEEYLSHRYPGTFVLQLRIMLERRIRKILNWCIEQLDRATTLSNILPTFGQDAEATAWFSSLYVYCYLWRQWNHEMVKAETRKSWATELEKLIGLSAAEMVQVITTTIMNFNGTSSPRPEPRNSPQCQEGDVHVLRRALDAAKDLSTESDDNFRTHFFRSLADRIDNFHKFNLEESVHGRIMDFVQAELNIVLPNLPSAEAAEENTGVGASDFTNGGLVTGLQREPSGGYDPTIAPSMSSSENSLKRVADRIIQHKRCQDRIEGSNISPSEPTWFIGLLREQSRPQHMDTLSISISSLSLSTQSSNRVESSSITQFPIPEEQFSHG